uniref:Uncharacterized protein n=1 Tax=Anopheles culicifacies TaxID=139723 RepID=A0A182M6I4_9DIPT
MFTPHDKDTPLRTSRADGFRSCEFRTCSQPVSPAAVVIAVVVSQSLLIHFDDRRMRFLTIFESLSLRANKREREEQKKHPIQSKKIPTMVLERKGQQGHGMYVV